MVNFGSVKCISIHFFLNLIASPAKVFYDMVKTSQKLQDPKEEDTESFATYKKDVGKIRTRSEFKITEAFRESLGSCRIQMAFYFAFSYIVGKELESVDCMTKSLLKDNEGIFTIYSTDWHGMPPLIFSASMSLISITMAQMSVYKI